MSGDTPCPPPPSFHHGSYHSSVLHSTVPVVGRNETRENGRLRLKCDGTRAKTRFRLSAKRTSPFKSAGTSVQSTTGSRVVRISGSNAGYTTFRGSVKGTGYPLHSPVSSSLPFPYVTVCHHISTGLHQQHPSCLKSANHSQLPQSTIILHTHPHENA
jgi:hypothetical protein